MVPTVLGPRCGTVDILVLRPGGETVIFEPLLRHCRGPHSRMLRAGDPPVRDSAFLHYGRDGYMFSAPGLYRLRARYTALDGAFVDSEPISIHVQPPRSAADRHIGELMYHDDQVGVLMSVLGSDDPALSGGSNALMEIIDRFPRHPAAAVARLVLGANAAREFKRIDRSGIVRVRNPQLGVARALVEPVVDVELLEARAGRVSADDHRGATAPRAIGTRAGVPRSVDAFIRSRSDEIAVEVPTISRFAVPASPRRSGGEPSPSSVTPESSTTQPRAPYVPPPSAA